MIAGFTSKSNIYEARLHGDDNYGMSIKFANVTSSLFTFDSDNWDYFVATH